MSNSPSLTPALRLSAKRESLEINPQAKKAAVPKIRIYRHLDTAQRLTGPYFQSLLKRYYSVALSVQLRVVTLFAIHLTAITRRLPIAFRLRLLAIRTQ